MCLLVIRFVGVTISLIHSFISTACCLYYLTFSRLFMHLQFLSFELSATSILTGANKSATNRGSFVGYSANGIPLYTFAEDALHRTAQSSMTLLRHGLKQVLEDDNSRKIFYFLLLNLVWHSRLFQPRIKIT